VSETVLETERLRLTNWQPEHLPELVRLHGDPEIARYFTAEGLPWSEERCRLRLERWASEFRDHRMGKLRVIRKEDGALLGRAGFGIHEPTGEPEIGYALFREHWGKGYATEAAAGLRDWIFRETPHDHFIGFAHEDNAASLAVLARIGMEPTRRQVIFDMPCQFFIYNRRAVHG